MFKGFINQKKKNEADTTFIEEEKKIITDSLSLKDAENECRMTVYASLPDFLITVQQFIQVKEPPIKNFVPPKSINDGDSDCLNVKNVSLK